MVSRDLKGTTFHHQSIGNQILLSQASNKQNNSYCDKYGRRPNETKHWIHRHGAHGERPSCKLPDCDDLRDG
jgi:hypothetical protein